MSTLPKHLCIDGKWVPCQPADGFGVLGLRQLCELTSETGHPGKRLLIRHRGSSAQFKTAKLPDTAGVPFRPAIGKAYQQAVPKKTDNSLRLPAKCSSKT